MTAQPILQTRRISQVYPGVQALEHVDFTMRRGEVTALIGENGAGKSTLIRIIAGVERPASGELLVDGSRVDFRTPGDSQAAGISVISQEFRLVPQLTVAENIFLGHEPTSGALISYRDMRRRATALMGELELDLDPDQRVARLSVADQQMVEISKALSREFDVLVMDEPTAALHGDEVSRLLRLVERLRERGKAILYVSHHLDEIFAVSDRIVVFRDGRNVADLVTATTGEDELVTHMLGRRLQKFEDQSTPSAVPNDTPVRLSLTEVTCPRVRTPITLEVRAGEVVGLAGLLGSGRTEFMQSLFGMLPAKGSIAIDGATQLLRSPADAIAAGVFMLSEDRKREGILPHLSVLENLVLSQRGKTGINRWLPMHRTEMKTYERLKSELRIRVDRAGQLIGNLSGGNQQKVLFGRAALSECSLLLLNEPTRGVDVGAKLEIYELIRSLTQQGVAVLVSSSDAPELSTVADRCLVFRTGRIAAELAGSDVNEEAILGASLGNVTGPGGDARSVRPVSTGSESHV
ncbi:sugar ABC transporter ATP-binding protein [Rhodococcus sp. T2V]|uniref:sugar ABC transporter ATP-binding protein n=1 Tax=Rhodococcus sp. T2V TaxID=3034164 RepID=UPI0023E1D179|nr:sugar ABC transporter ATP-binding protein [Rhodococcus sp. T2V]MDF3310630.1 sugar ABC transporter ATP-binding protein [Rhodococcus sp. T2V]